MHEHKEPEVSTLQEIRAHNDTFYEILDRKFTEGKIPEGHFGTPHRLWVEGRAIQCPECADLTKEILDEMHSTL